MKAVASVVLAATLLCGCGTAAGDRSLSGAGIGVIGGAPGVIVGGLAGAGVGLVSSPRAIDLGQPIWRR